MQAARVEEEEIAALNQAIAEAKAALKKKHAAVALTPEQDAQLNVSVVLIYMCHLEVNFGK